MSSHSWLGLETSIFIYHFEDNPHYQPLSKMVQEGVQAGTWTTVTSMLTLMELTVRPRRLKQAAVEREYEVLLLNFPHLSMVEVSRSITRRAAQLRALYHIRPADALQAATALVEGATALIMNDLGLARLAPELVVILLEALAGNQ